ncbi:MAG: hypothetical protein KC620_05235 [Myxococcales bacterium]|nr:hypothetical protein [Myxococcales bacterium]
MVVRLWWVLLAALVAWGCAEDADEGEQREQPVHREDAGRLPPGGWTSEETPPPGENNSGLGAECARPDGCSSDSADWPDCLNGQCTTGDCTYPGAFNSDYGYCTVNCTEDHECANAVDGPYGAEYHCLSDGTSGVCAPGSNQRCDRGRDGRCDNEDEVCKWGLIYAPDRNYGGVCQPATAGGRDVGEACNEEAGVFCANDMCLFSTCTSLCDPSNEESTACPDGWRCFKDFDIGVTLDVCLPTYCERNADCDDGFTCALGFEFNSDTVLRGICLKTDEGMAQPGEVCTAERECQGAACLDDEDGEGFCSGMCNTDDDCGPGAYCDIINFGISAEPGSAPAQICIQGERTGSGRNCQVDADCAAAGNVAEEACEYYISGQLEGGRYVEEPHAAGRCAAIPNNAVDYGAQCSGVQPCHTESLCLRSTGNNTFCSEVCRDTRDCAAGSVCFALDLGGAAGGVCVPANLIGAAGSSLAACSNDTDCGDAEHCRLNVIETDPPIAETLCFAGRTGGAPGADCAADEDCRAANCQPRSTDLTVPGFCEAPCRGNEDCGAGFTCERTRPLAGANAVRVCRPADVCMPCAFDGTTTCGGGNVCSKISFGNLGEGNACLVPCSGPDDQICAPGFSCSPQLDGAGRVVDGSFACAPVTPNETCRDALPR